MTITNLLQVAPLVLLLLAVAVIVWRGMRTKPDADSNKSDIGGGSGGGHSAD